MRKIEANLSFSQTGKFLVFLTFVEFENLHSDVFLSLVALDAMLSAWIS